MDSPIRSESPPIVENSAYQRLLRLEEAEADAEGVAGGFRRKAVRSSLNPAATSVGWSHQLTGGALTLNRSLEPNGGSLDRTAEIPTASSNSRSSGGQTQITERSEGSASKERHDEFGGWGGGGGAEALDNLGADDPIEARMMRNFDELDDEEMSVQARIRHEELLNLQMREEEFRELQHVYAQQVRRSFRTLRRFPEPSLHSRYLMTEEDEDAREEEEEWEDPTDDELDVPCSACVCGSSDQLGVIESLVGHSPTCYARQRQLALQEQFSDLSVDANGEDLLTPTSANGLEGGGTTNPSVRKKRKVRPSANLESGKGKVKAKKSKSFVKRLREMNPTTAETEPPRLGEGSPTA
jgi:hypothetical protein